MQRFLREASIQGRLEHPAIVPVHELGRDPEGRPFFAMKKLTGTTLAKILDGEDAAFSRQRLLRAFAEVCLAVEFAHVRGVVHRDLKPENIVLGDFGEVYVLDWGIAKVVGEDDGQFADVDSGEHATVAGTALGTPGYMAPEQVRGTEIDGRADVYALGCVLFDILAGEGLHPRGRGGMQSALLGVDARPSVRAPGRDIPPELDALCVEATALDREARIATARQVGDRVQRYLDGDRDVALRRQMARDHLDRARTAFEAGGDQQRVAMREAGSALALDPALAGVAELVGRLMIEPPSTQPVEVEDAMAEDEERTTRSQFILVARAFAAFMLFMPILWWLAPEATTGIALLTACEIVMGLGCWQIARARRWRPHLALIVCANVAIIAAVSRIFTPLLIAPGFAMLATTSFALIPIRSRSTAAPVIVALMAGAVVVPLILERIGVLERTVAVHADGILLKIALAGEGSALAVWSVYVFAMVACAAIMAGAIKRRERDMKRHLLVQAWQLRQLVAA